MATMQKLIAALPIAAMAEFKRAHGLRERLRAVDWTSSYFRKETGVKVDWGAHARDRARLQGRAPGPGRRKRAG
jgi:hypothetical protein